jgi:hypothetical protein
MQKKLRQLILILLFLRLGGLGGFAQSFPVIINTQFTQPSPIYLSNYADATTVNSPIRIQLTLNDLTLSNIQVRLKFYLQGGGVSLVSNDYVVGASPLYLQGGFPTQLTNVELAPYFEFQNLLGINPNEYAQPLREGMYNLYVEVFDFATGNKLSKRSGTTTIIFQNEPPFLNLPLNKASIMQQNIQNITFSWSPRSINVSNVEYEFALVEITDKYTPVQNAFLYSPPLYTTTTRSTSLVYGIMAPQLIPGKNYAWRVHAKALKGAEEIGVFKNNGNSEVFGFSYDILCNAPTSVTTTGASQDQAKITWSGAIDNYDYEIKYREKGSNSKWYSLITPREYATIANLKPKTTYEYTVGAACELGKYVHGSVQEFTTTAQDEIAIAGCGIKPDPTDLKNKTPLPALFQNDVVTAGDFPIVVWHATGSNGTFSGDGYVTLPFLDKFRVAIDAADATKTPRLGGAGGLGKYSRIKITFTNIGVNTDFKLISGEIVASYDPNWGSILDGDKLLNPVIDQITASLKEAVDVLLDLLDKNKNGITNQQQFETVWTKNQEILVAQTKLLYNNTDLPQSVKDDIKKYVKDPYIVSTDKTIPKSADFKQTQDNLVQMSRISTEIEQTEKAFQELIANLGVESVLKCKKCDEKTKSKTVAFDKTSASSFSINPYNKERYKCILGALVNGKFEFKKIESNKPDQSNINPTLSASAKKAFDSSVDGFLKVVYTDNILIDCKILYPHTQICSSSTIINEQTKKEIAEEVEKCYNSDKINIILPALANSARSNQGVEFFYNNAVYHIGKDGVEKVATPLTDAQINSGDWTTAEDVKIRYEINDAGVIQYKAIGIRSNLVLSEGKTANLVEVSAHIKTKGNAFFTAYKVTQPELSPAKSGINLNNDNETFADGKKMAIDNNASFIKISCEGLGLLTSLAKTAEIEKPAYLESTENKTTIHAPGMVTGSIEAGAKLYTDITGVVIMVYDVAVDEKARTDAYTGLVKIKNEVKQEPTKLFPMFFDIIVQEASGNTPADWGEIKEDKTDTGRKGHLYTKGVVRTTLTLVASGPLLAKLPKMAEDLAKKMDNVLEHTTAETLETLKKLFIKSIDETITKLKSKAKYVLEGTGDYLTVGGHHPLAKKAFENVMEYDFKKAFSVSVKELEEIGDIGIHSKITGQQNSLYSAWKKANPLKKMGIEEMSEIEIKAMVNAGIPEDIATGWVVKSLEELKINGVTEIKNIPWNGVN